MIPFVDQIPGSILQDVYSADDNVKVQIDCPNRNGLAGWLSPIQAVLLTDIQLDANPEWQSAGTSMGIPSKIQSFVGAADTLAQAAAGASVQQPWFARETYKGTKPMSLSLDFRFYADDDQDLEVLSQVNRLLSLCFPRKTGILNQALSAIGNLVDFYVIPGPSPFYPLVTNGDYLNISVGNFMYWEACYITGLSGYISSVLGPNGKPNYAEMKMKFKTMDSQFVNEDGTFNVFTTQYQSMTEGILGTLQGAYKAAQEGVASALKAVGG